MIRKIIGIVIHVLLLVTMTLAGYCTFIFLACYVPVFRFLPGYDPDPLGWGIALAILWPAIGILGILALVTNKILHIPLVTGLLTTAYPVIVELYSWSTVLEEHRPSYESLLVNAFPFVNALLFSVSFILLVLLTLRYIRKEMREKETNPELGRLILQIVDNQIRDGEPIETRQTKDRLISEGYTDDEARRLISMAVTVEIFRTLKFKEEFNRQRFVKNLNNLPREPWED